MPCCARSGRDRAGRGSAARSQTRRARAGRDRTAWPAARASGPRAPGCGRRSRLRPCHLDAGTHHGGARGSHPDSDTGGGRSQTRRGGRGFHRMSVAPAPVAPLKSALRSDRAGEGAWRIALGLVCLTAVALVIGLGTRLNFFNDDWWFLLQRPGLESRGGLDTIFAPHNANLVVLLALSFKVLVAAFGMHSLWPFRIVL